MSNEQSHAQHHGASANDNGQAFNDAVENGKAYVQKAANDLKKVAQERAEGFCQQAEDFLGDAQSHVRSFQQESEEFIRENPTKSVLYALGLGVILGIFLKR